MPTYEYEFTDGTVVELTQSIYEDALLTAKHPVTGEWRPVKRVYSAPGVVLKGRGFYRTGG